jgi:hypothetical protein
MSILNQQTQVSLTDALVFANSKDICVIHQENDCIEIVKIWYQSDYQQWEGCFTFLG